MSNTSVKAYDWLPTDAICEFGQRIEERTVRTTYLDTGRHRDETDERCCPKCDPFSSEFVPPEDMLHG